MSDIEIAVKYSREIESLLVDRFGAQGRGLHEKTSSVEAQLPSEITRKIRFVASVRNKVVHEDGFDMNDHHRFVTSGDDVIAYLEDLPKSGNRFSAWFLNSRTNAHDFLVSKSKPFSILLASIGGSWGWYSIGVGAGLMLATLGAISGWIMLSHRAVRFYIDAMIFVACFMAFSLFLVLIAYLWNVARLS